MDNCRGVAGNGIVVEREALGTDELFVAMVGSVFDGFCEDGLKGINSAQLVVWDDHEERKQCPPDGEHVLVTCSAIAWPRHDKRIKNLFNTRLLNYGGLLDPYDTVWTDH